MSMGSCVSVRSFLRLGSSLSLHAGATTYVAFTSVYGYASLSSSLSVRNRSRLARSVSTFDYLALGSTVSVRNVARMGERASVGGSFSEGVCLLCAADEESMDHEKCN